MNRTEVEMAQGLPCGRHWPQSQPMGRRDGCCGRQRSEDPVLRHGLWRPAGLRALGSVGAEQQEWRRKPYFANGRQNIGDGGTTGGDNRGCLAGRACVTKGEAASVHR